MDHSVWMDLWPSLEWVVQWLPVVVFGFTFGQEPGTAPTRARLLGGTDFLGPDVRQALMQSLFGELGIGGQFSQQAGQPIYGEGFKGQRGPQVGTTPTTLGFQPGPSGAPGAGFKGQPGPSGAPGAGFKGRAAPFSFQDQLQAAFQAPYAVNPFVAQLQAGQGPNQFLSAFQPYAMQQAGQLFGGQGLTPSDLRLFGEGQQLLREGLTQRGLNLGPAGAGIEAQFANRFLQDIADRQFGRQQQALGSLLGGAGQEQAGQALNLQRMTAGAGAFEQARAPDPFARALQGFQATTGAEQARRTQAMNAALAALGLAVPKEFAVSEGGGGGGGTKVGFLSS